VIFTVAPSPKLGSRLIFAGRIGQNGLGFPSKNALKSNQITTSGVNNITSVLAFPIRVFNQHPFHSLLRVSVLSDRKMVDAEFIRTCNKE
jgi:hypothetical protein